MLFYLAVVILISGLVYFCLNYFNFLKVDKHRDKMEDNQEKVFEQNKVINKLKEKDSLIKELKEGNYQTKSEKINKEYNGELEKNSYLKRELKGIRAESILAIAFFEGLRTLRENQQDRRWNRRRQRDRDYYDDYSRNNFNDEYLFDNGDNRDEDEIDENNSSYEKGEGKFSGGGASEKW